MRQLISLVSLVVASTLSAQAPSGAAKPRPDLRESPAGPTPSVATPPPQHRVVVDTGRTVRRWMTATPFVRGQTILSLSLYSPAFAATVSDRAIPRVAAYAVMAGGSIVAARLLARRLEMSDAAALLATRAPIVGAATGATVQYAITGTKDYAAGLFVGSLLGATGALTFGQRLSSGAAMASIFGAEMMTGLSIGTLYAVDEDFHDARTRAAIGAGAAVAGLQLGAMYGTYATYHVTAGDINALWTTSLIGTAAGGAFVANGNPDHRTTAFALLGGTVAGLAAGDYLLVRRVDHTRSQGMLVGAAGAAGALMGGGVAVLIGAGERFNATTAALGAAGAAGGVWAAERLMGKRPDAGQRLGAQLTVNPQALAFVAARVPGTHSLVRFAF